MQMVGISPAEDHHLPWHRDVYVEHESDFPDDWAALRKRCLARDRGCIRCGARGKTARLTVHHIIPRRDGGGDGLYNLATLCTSCHDYVEASELQTLTEIECIDEQPIKKPQLKSIRGRIETFDRPAWHAWVYGGDKSAKERQQDERLEAIELGIESQSSQ